MKYKESTIQVVGKSPLFLTFLQASNVRISVYCILLSAAQALGCEMRTISLSELRGCGSR